MGLSPRCVPSLGDDSLALPVVQCPKRGPSFFFWSSFTVVYNRRTNFILVPATQLVAEVLRAVCFIRGAYVFKSQRLVCSCPLIMMADPFISTEKCREGRLLKVSVYQLAVKNKTHRV